MMCRRELMPERYAASGLLPIAYRYRPNVVLWVMKLPAIATASMMITGSGIPP